MRSATRPSAGTPSRGLRPIPLLPNSFAGRRRRLDKRLRRGLHLAHRWLGILTCLLFAAWFVSGAVMMYVGFPRLSEAERRAALPPVALDRVALTPDEALARSGLPGAPRGLALAMLDDEPVYRILEWDGARRTVSAADGRRIEALAPERARAVATRHPAAAAVEDLGPVLRDQWTVPQRYDPLRPFRLLALGDPAGTRLYVSEKTGEIALDTTRRERFWNWLGAVPHWIYLTPLRARPELWRDVVLWVSGIAIAGAVSGVLLGLIRLRLRRRYAEGAVTPYRGWAAWHHLGGLVGGTALLTFIVSGWLSMNPNRWFSSPAPERDALERYAGSAQIPYPFDREAVARACPDLREVRFSRLDGAPLVLAACGEAPPRPCCGTPAPDRAHILAAARHLIPEAPSPRVERIEAEDAYWYGHHEARPLPVLRLVFADPSATWFHVDPATGEILSRMDRSARVSRWLFNGLHSLDVAPLIRSRPAWDALMLGLIAGGLVIALSGTVIGWRRLRRMGTSRAARASPP